MIATRRATLYTRRTVSKGEWAVIAFLIDRFKRLRNAIRAYRDNGRYLTEVEAAADVENSALLDAFEAWLGERKSTAKQYRRMMSGFADYVLNEAYSPLLKDARAGDIIRYWFSDYEPFDGMSQLGVLLNSLEQFFTFLVEAGHAPKHVLLEAQRAIAEYEDQLTRRAERQDRS